MDIKAGDVAFITGGASGIGFGVAQAFAAAGMRIVIADIDTAAAEKAVSSLAEDGADVMAVTLDVSDEASWTAAVAKAEQRFGAIDVLCNNAGIAQGRLPDGGAIPLVQMSPKLFRMILDINVVGIFLGARAVVPGMIRRGRGGHVVNTASMAGMFSSPGLGAYSTSKFAAVGISENLRTELSPLGVGVSVLCPGGVQGNLSATSAARRSAVLTPDAGPEAALTNVRLSTFTTMEARPVGERVLQAVRNDEFYIFTHPEYEALMDERFKAVLSAIGPSAQPGYADPPSMMTANRSPIYAETIARNAKKGG